AAIDGGGGRTPVFVKLKAACPSLDLLNKTGRQACIAFAEETEIHWKGVGSLKHPENMPRARRACRRSRPRRGTRPTAHHCGKTRIKRLLYLLRTDEVDVHVDAAGGHNFPFARDHFGAWSDDDVDVRLDTRIASFPYGGNAAVGNADVGLHD